MADDTPTPPHHPTFSVHLSDSQIHNIFDAVFSNVRVIEIEQLQRGQSFNNRIYFITAVVESVQREFALKVSGQFFSGRKVENEVGCLALLAHYCPTVPTPKVIAWSLDGVHVESNQSIGGGAGSEKIDTRSSVLEDTEQARSWILLGRLPGQRLVVEESKAANQQYRSLMKQLASHVHTWRTSLPRRQQFGNLRLVREGFGTSQYSSFKINVAGLILCENMDQACQIQTKRDYILQRIEDALQTLRTNPSFSEAHRIQIQSLIQADNLPQRLDRMAIVNQNVDVDAHFTHYDFAPRNMLVHTDPKTGDLLLTGILDFEFAGFFPIEEEFTNDTIGNEGDWPWELYLAYIDDLEELGCQVPSLPTKLVDSDSVGSALQNTSPIQFSFRQWNEAVLLTQLIDNIAPWRIVAGSYKGEELAEKLSEAAGQIKSVAGKLFQT